MTKYNQVVQYIKNANTINNFYNDIRSILAANNCSNYPEDYQIKQLQRLADAKYEELARAEK